MSVCSLKEKKKVALAKVNLIFVAIHFCRIYHYPFLLLQDLSREKEGPVQSSFTEGQRGVVKPVYKPPGDRSKVIITKN